MKNLIKSHKYFCRLVFAVGLAMVLMFSLWGMLVSTANADGPLTGAGYLDFSYGTAVHADPTAEKPESKLWWNDGFWWGSLYNQTAGEYRIYRLNWGTQIWEDTGVAIDDREDTRGDALWDETDNKLYVVSHVAVDNSSRVNDPANWARLYRYSYDKSTQTYSLDGGFPSNVNRDKSEAVVLAKDSTGRLWITYVSRPSSSSPYQVYVNASAGGSLNDDDNWGTPNPTPFTPSLNITPTAVYVAQDDIASIVGFDISGANKIGIMWSNQLSGTLNFAYRNDGDPVGATWTHESVPVPAGGGGDDHINIKSLKAGPNGVYAAVKTSGMVNPGDPLIGLVTRDPGGTLAFHTYSTVQDADTRPLLLLDEGASLARIFVAGKDGGNMICYKSLAFASPPSTMGNFPAGDCGPGGGGEPTEFIEDEAGPYNKINNPTSTKQNVKSYTGLVVLASHEDLTAVPTETVYVHNVLGDPSPVVTARGPVHNATNVQVSAVVTATFSKNMNSSTLNTSNFTVEDGSGPPIAGAVSYASGTRTATFDPTSLLKANTIYTVKLTENIRDTTNNKLNEGFETGLVREQWSFSTGAAAVQFSQLTYSVDEGAGTATITGTLNTPSSLVVTVPYNTSDGTATNGSDYTAVNGTLTFNPGDTSATFTVPIIDDASDEPDETVNLTLGSPTNATLGTPASATLTILDNDGPPTVQFDPTVINVNEGVASGTATIQVTLSAASAFTVMVDYATSDGTATDGSDYTAISGTLTIDPGDIGKTFDVSIINDTVDEPDETVLLTLTNPVSATLGIPGDSATLTILNDDQGKIYLPLILRD